MAASSKNVYQQMDAYSADSFHSLPSRHLNMLIHSKAFEVSLDGADWSMEIGPVGKLSLKSFGKRAETWSFGWFTRKFDKVDHRTIVILLVLLVLGISNCSIHLNPVEYRSWFGQLSLRRQGFTMISNHAAMQGSMTYTTKWMYLTTGDQPRLMATF